MCCSPSRLVCASAFVCTDKASSWESREASRSHLLCFYSLKAGVFDQSDQVGDAASPGVKARSPTPTVLLAREIGNDEAPPWFEHPGDFRESLAFEGNRQMVHHQGREHRIERLIGEGKLLNHPDLELDRKTAPGCFRAGTSDLLCPRINACHMACLAHAA